MGAGGEVDEKKVPFQEPGTRKNSLDRRTPILSQLLEGIRVNACPRAPNPNIWRLPHLRCGGVSHPVGKKQEKFLLSPSLPSPGLTSREAEQDQSDTHLQGTYVDIFSHPGPEVGGREDGEMGRPFVEGCNNESTHTLPPHHVAKA